MDKAKQLAKNKNLILYLVGKIAKALYSSVQFDFFLSKKIQFNFKFSCSIKPCFRRVRQKFKGVDREVGIDRFINSDGQNDSWKLENHVQYKTKKYIIKKVNAIRPERFKESNINLNLMNFLELSICLKFIFFNQTIEPKNHMINKSVLIKKALHILQ